MMNGLGKHLLIDIFDCKIDLTDEKYITETLDTARDILGVKELHSWSKQFPGRGKNECGGVTGVKVIIESHLTIHTYPEFNLAMADFFTCGNMPDFDCLIAFLKKRFKTERCMINLQIRGNYINIDDG